MSSSASKLLSGLAAAAGVGFFVMPLVAPWYLLAVFAAALAATFMASGGHRVLVGAVAFLVVLLVFQGHLSAPMAAACLSASALAMTKRVALAIAILLLNLSAVASGQELLGNLLHSANLEAASPAALGALVLSLVAASWLRVAFVLGSVPLAVGSIWMISMAAPTPEILLAVGAAPVTLVGAVLGTAEPAPRWSTIPLGGILIAALATWFWMPPRAPGETWLLLPEAPQAYEAKFFSNYVEALRFAGVTAKRASSADEIAAGATVLMPWVTAAFANDQRIGDLARKRRWTVLIGGEHTNLGDVASRIEAMAGRALLRRDLTVPRGNTDESGPMRMVEIGAWPIESILNRGASVTISSLADKVLLAGDGWWAEPDISEWLWVGDYVWHPGDRAGRLAVAAASDIDGARWVILGDNSPLVNNQLIADPRAASRILQAASLWPAFINDLLLTVLALVIAFGIAPVIVVLLPVAATFAIMTFYRPSQAWKDAYLGEFGFEERNFNNVIAENPTLVSGRRLIRLKAPVSGQIELPEGPATIFMLVDVSAEIGDVHLDHCHRLGQLATSEGPYLMDAQACRVTGQAKVLIGTKEAAAAIMVDETTVILDAAFLGQKAPGRNAAWLLKEIEQ